MRQAIFLSLVVLACRVAPAWADQPALPAKPSGDPVPPALADPPKPEPKPPELPPPPVRAEPQKPEDKPRGDPAAVEVQFADGSSMKITFREESIEVTTTAGKKTVRLADLRKVELAPRLADEDAKQVNAAIKNLGSDNFRDRQRATTDLLRMGVKAYPALLAASKAEDAETRRRASDLLDQLKGALPEEMFNRVSEDVVWTREGKLVGKVNQATWKVDTQQFGPVQMRLGEVVRARWLAYEEPEPPLAVQPDPGNVQNLAAQINKVFAFKVTGQMGGAVYGTGTYTSDSTIGTAAVHAGLLKPGETKVLKVKIVTPLNAYTGSTKNGITSSGYGYWGGAYEFVK